VGFVERGLALLEDRGYAVMPADEAGSLREGVQRIRSLEDNVRHFAETVIDHFASSPLTSDASPESRESWNRQSRRAFMEDPLAGAEADHYANFALQRGVKTPQARDKRVQAVIDAAWEDPANVDKLVGFEALRAISNELRATANVFPVAFVGGGRVRVSFLEADRVREVVTDDEDRHRPLFYVVEGRKRKWDYETDTWQDVPQNEDGTGKREVRYFRHWRNVDEAIREREDRGEDALEMPPAEKLGEGLVYHARVNRLLEQQFGVPLWRRTLRFYTAMNRFTESRVAMAQASTQFIAKRVMKGGPAQVMRAANGVLAQTSELGTGRANVGENGQPPASGRAGSAPVRPGSTFLENESHRLEAMQLNSGAAAAVQDAQIIRAAAVAPSGFGPHYFGDTGSANLATASSLELPALMAVGAWQETLEQILRWFTDLAIQEAVKAGALGGRKTKDGERPLSELCLWEEADKAEAERRTGADLSYSIALPFPGRRNLPDVVQVFTQLMTVVPGAAANEPLAKAALSFLFEHGLGVDDVAGLTEQVTERLSEQAAEAQAQSQAISDPNQPPVVDPAADASGGAQAGGKRPDGGTKAEPNSQTDGSTYGERSGVPKKKKSGAVTEQDVEDALFAILGGEWTGGGSGNGDGGFAG
jgi:hypothetical protein